MRILLISNIFPPGFLGGYELGALDVARGLQQSGHEVLVLTSDFYPDDENQLRELPVERVLQCTEPSRELLEERDRIARGFYINQHNLRMLVRSVLRFAPERVLCFNLLGLGVLGILRYLVSIGLPPIVYLMDDLFFALRHAPKQRQRFLRTCGDLQFVDDADYVVMSGNLAKQVEASLGMTLTRKFLVPGWFHAGRGACDAPWSEPKAQPATRFVFASRIAAHKGIDLALQAVQGALQQGRSDFTLDVFGSGDVARLLQAINAYGVGTHVRYQGCPEKEELGRRLRDYDALLFPTHEREPFGFVVSEAAWARCIPVMTAGIGASEWFLDQVDSLKIARTVPGLTAAMLQLLSMPAAARERMQWRAQKTAQDHLQFDRAMNTVQKIVTSRGGAPAAPVRAVRHAELALAVLDDLWRRANRV